MRRLSRRLTLLSLVFAPGAFAWSWPVDGAVLRPFALGDDPYAGGPAPGHRHRRRHRRRRSRAGRRTVSFVGSVPNGGRAVTIRTGDGYAVTLLQLGRLSLEEGAQVGEGESVGAVGESRDSVTKAPHVHLGVRVAADEHGYVDPLSLLPSRAAPPEPAPAPRRRPRSRPWLPRRLPLPAAEPPRVDRAPPPVAVAAPHRLPRRRPRRHRRRPRSPTAPAPPPAPPFTRR